MILEVFKQWSQ